MKIVTIMGSPNLKGKTAGAMELFEKELRAKGHEVERINIAEKSVLGCRGCHACTKISDRPGCIQKDDAEYIFGQMIGADEIVYGSPLIGWDISSQIKPLFDRHYSMVKGYMSPHHKSFIENKSVSLLITCAGPEEKNADLVQVFFDRMGIYLKAKNVRKFILPWSMRDDFYSRAEIMGHKIVSEMISCYI